MLDARAKAATPAGSGFGYSYSDAGLVGVTGTVEHAEVGALAHSLIGCLKVSGRRLVGSRFAWGCSGSFPWK